MEKVSTEWFGEVHMYIRDLEISMNPCNLTAKIDLYK